MLIISLFVKVSKTPSDPIKTKSISSVSNSKISGSQITEPFLPPNYFNLLSTSPIVRETERPPGLILQGPKDISYDYFTKFLIFFKSEKVCAE